MSRKLSKEVKCKPPRSAPGPSVLPLVRLHVKVAEDVLGQLHSLFPGSLTLLFPLWVNSVQSQQLFGQ